ncbi:hypothetical protein TTHERM_00526420 (macronuclear) [Tetrahymena thermophila SB210]|uniref:Nuclear cap-binding protein subunit 3 n=1 Tax=Tetrahymena thermophila (strain SB210) TaxID=312017 RepID=I7LY70_TETTS|nr:hypothetical protein TTHERM_00526420 [Tetrahymena thermophila SB210]EAS07811.2 hypothetical protein TTHERM_00526420 [Tetrahymena thermophila SB210]|eukprot:XP_001028053.2 hypothetical protein TTHERM_00526420 [Tetrahymena thermophila SB210]
MSTESDTQKQNEEIKASEDQTQMELETSDVKQDGDKQKDNESEQTKANDNPDEMTLEDLIKTEKKSLRDRIIKQKQKVKVIEGKNFNERQNINFEDETLELRSEVLHVYGVDFLSTQDIMSYFSRFNPEKIEWLNDSSCNVVFPSEELVEQAVQSLSLTIQNDPNLSDEWKKGIPYKERNIEFSLYFRIATTKDVKGQQISGKESQYYKYIRQKTQDQRLQRQKRYEERNSYRGNSKSYNDRGRSQQQSKRHSRSNRADTKDWRRDKLNKDSKRNKKNRTSSSRSQDGESNSDKKNQSKSRSRSRSQKDQYSNKSSSPASKSPKEEKRSQSKETQNKKNNEEAAAVLDQQENDNDDL